MTGPLEGCHAKLRRAYQHLESLTESFKQWGETRPYALVESLDADAQHRIVKISQVRETPVLTWGIITGDVLHNLRSTLDHLVCALIRQEHPSNACRRTGFPVLRDEAQWDVQRDGRPAPNSGLAKLGPISEPWTIATIRSLQPFVRWREAGNREPLWILNELVNTDKHRTLNLGTVFLSRPEIEFDPPQGAQPTWVRPAGPFDDGDELVRYRLTEGFVEGHVTPHTRFGADIVFKDPGPAEGTKVDVMLNWLFDSVVYVVDLFDYKFFDGKPPAGTKRAVISASGTQTSAGSGGTTWYPRGEAGAMGLTQRRENSESSRSSTRDLLPGAASANRHDRSAA